MKKITVAIDGFSSSGKSTMARELARLSGYKYIDSGAMYRAVTHYALENGLIGPDKMVDIAGLLSVLPDITIDFNPAGADGIQHTLLNGRDVEQEIRTMRVSGLVSIIAAIPEVREHLVRLQREFGKEGGIVMDGRDIGTTVFPDAELKIFVVASPEVRARRRVEELIAKGEDADYNQVLENVKSRDYIDSTRAVSPLSKAEDAIVLDNDHLSRTQQMEWLMDIFNRSVSHCAGCE